MFLILCSQSLSVAQALPSRAKSRICICDDPGSQTRWTLYFCARSTLCYTRTGSNARSTDTRTFLCHVKRLLQASLLVAGCFRPQLPAADSSTPSPSRSKSAWHASLMGTTLHPAAASVHISLKDLPWSTFSYENPCSNCAFSSCKWAPSVRLVRGSQIYEQRSHSSAYLRRSGPDVAARSRGRHSGL